ncbi:ECF transporter S component [Corynebacterium pyruviciproducens]|uniref:ECF transporter S component n=1 Tax=Corynebacterium pyruviciproducens TaxID=598660 RepID=UPI0023F02D6B|nr:ECF transporter S component [Corynebacterium pyruviciproducens]MDK6564939.1 ECF transporter S component [Corynebacterium pyruviciproducens]
MSTRNRLVLTWAGALLIAATWLYLVLVRPTQWDSIGGSSEALITLVGYVGGAVLLIAGIVPRLTARDLGLIPVALVINIVVGQIVGSTGLPLYLDSVGTMLVAALAGPVAGLATGALSSVVWGVFNPMALPFAAGSGLTGLLAGYAIHKFKSFEHPWRIIPAGAIMGVIVGMLSAPVAAFVYGGTAGVGTGALVSAFRAMGNSLLESVTLQSLASDPLDKIVVLFIVWGIIKVLPASIVKPQQ